MNNVMQYKQMIKQGFAIVDKNYIIQYVDDGLSDILKADREYLIQKNIKQITPAIGNLKFTDDSSAKYIQSPHHKEIYFQINKMPIPLEDTFLIFCFDYSRYKVLLEQLNDLNEQIYLYQSMLNDLQDGVFITNGDGETLFVNDAFLSLSNLTREDIIGKTVYYLIENKIVPNSCCAKVLETGSPTSTINNYYEGKSCLVSGHPIFDSNMELKMAFSIIRDVSELEQLKQRLEKEKNLSITYKTKIKQLENKNTSKPMINNSKSMANIYDKIPKIANLDTSILILGETGVGKDFLAKYIHDIGNRGEEGPFLKINCGAIPEPLLESELFGYEAGAFTGASKNGKPGLFELANNGTLYLDEIGDMPYNLQVKLLSALQDKKAYRLGGHELIPFNSRVIAATNADLEELVKQKKFRIDLYYRLNVIDIKIPPLRHREDDIIPLAMKFLNEFNHQYDQNKYFASETLELCLLYEWPGNIREMKNLIERLVIISDKDCIEPETFYNQIAHKSNLNYDLAFTNAPNFNIEDSYGLKAKVERYESYVIKNTLQKADTLKEAANILNIDISTLVRKKKKYGIQ